MVLQQLPNLCYWKCVCRAGYMVMQSGIYLQIQLRSSAFLYWTNTHCKSTCSRRPATTDSPCSSEFSPYTTRALITGQESTSSPAVSILAHVTLQVVCVIKLSVGHGSCDASLLKCHPGIPRQSTLICINSLKTSRLYPDLSAIAKARERLGDPPCSPSLFCFARLTVIYRQYDICTRIWKCSIPRRPGGKQQKIGL